MFLRFLQISAPNSQEEYDHSGFACYRARADLHWMRYPSLLLVSTFSFICGKKSYLSKPKKPIQCCLLRMTHWAAMTPCLICVGIFSNNEGMYEHVLSSTNEIGLNLCLAQLLSDISCPSWLIFWCKSWYLPRGRTQTRIRPRQHPRICTGCSYHSESAEALLKGQSLVRLVDWSC